MKKLVFGWLAVVLMSTNVFAAPIKTWTFHLSNGTMATLTLNQVPTSCPNSSKIFEISAGSFVSESDLCLDDPKRPDHLFGWFEFGTNGEVAAFYLYQGSEYARIIQEIAEFGTPGKLPIGNAVDGKCTPDADAFIMLSGDRIGDVPTYGYCLNPQ